MAGQKEIPKHKKRKRAKGQLDKPPTSHQPEHKFTLERGRHMYGVQPLGNMYIDGANINVRDLGVGNLRFLRDDIVLDILSLLSAQDLCSLSMVSKGFYVFAHQDELWRSLVLQNFGGNFEFSQCWKLTYQQAVSNNSVSVHNPLKVTGFYSDHLFQSWLCASLRIEKKWLTRDNIPRRSNLSLPSFIQDFEEKNRPVIITDALSDWPALRLWNRSYLLENAGHASFTAGPIEIQLSRFLKYSDEVQEERPLYIFDSKFAEKCSQLGEDYSVPKYFREDLFSVMGKERPDYRWLIMGPARSGSSWHIDPNSTSAWNAVVKGSKKWILYPPGEIPPGVRPSPDGADVATSVSLTEWLMNFYAESQQGDRPKPVEGICKEGEVIFVPRGWWHMVINLEESIAITQNYVSRRNLLQVLDFLSQPNARALVSGTRDRESLHDKFCKQFDTVYPGELEKLRNAAAELAGEKDKPTFWETVADKNVGAFKFGF